MVRTASQHCVKRDCRRRQDGDDAVKHGFVEMLVLANRYLCSLYRLFGISSTAIFWLERGKPYEPTLPTANDMPTGLR